MRYAASRTKLERYSEQEDGEQMLVETKTARRQARGLPDITEEDYRAQVARELRP